jgi:hypothetical protein
MQAARLSAQRGEHVRENCNDWSETIAATGNREMVWSGRIGKYPLDTYRQAFQSSLEVCVRRRRGSI